MLGAALDHQGLAGSVWIVAGQTVEAENLSTAFVSIAKERGLSGTLRHGGRQVVIGETVFHFITLSEDGTIRGVTCPRFVDHAAVEYAVRRLIRETAGGGPP